MILADNEQQAMFKFNRKASDREEYISCEEVKNEKM